MYNVVLAVHIILAVCLIGLVLLQQGKGADVGAITGSGGANTLFGVSGASTMLVKMTTTVAILFMLTSVLLVRLAVSGGGYSGEKYDPLKGSALEGVAAAVPTAPSSETAIPQPVAPIPSSSVSSEAK